MRHRNAVHICLLPLQQRRYISVHLHSRRNHQHRDQHARQRHPHCRQRSLHPRQPPRAIFFRARQSDSQQHGQRWPSAKAVILHSRSKCQREKQQNESAPQRQQQFRLLRRIQILPRSHRRKVFARCHQENTPRKKPDQMRSQPQPQRYGFVVRRKPCPHRALEMLIDKIRPEKRLRPQSSQQVPRRGHNQENQRARNQRYFAQLLPSARCNYEQRDNSYRKNHAH